MKGAVKAIAWSMVWITLILCLTITQCSDGVILKSIAKRIGCEERHEP
jgi:hypothetical protein